MCSVSGCDRKVRARGLCAAHYERWRKGQPLEAPVRSYFRTDDLWKRLRRYAPEGDPNECWEWNACRNKGYGVVATKGGKVRQAHVVTWEVINGKPLPPGMVTRHTCDNPACVNPRHIVVGTHADNVADKVARGRQAKGASHGLTTLTESDVDAIRSMYRSGATQRALAQRFGVSQGTISNIVNGKTWRYHGNIR